MADISKISVGESTYDIKDATARGSVEELTTSLGALAFKDGASGSFTPSGTVSVPTITVSPTTKSVKVMDTSGVLPTWSASVSEETLSFAFTQGSMPTTSTETVVTGIADATSSRPTFSGTAGTVSVS